MEIKEFKLGSDPEIFLQNKETKQLFPAIGLIHGTKDNLNQWMVYQKDLHGK